MHVLTTARRETDYFKLLQTGKYFLAKILITKGWPVDVLGKQPRNSFYFRKNNFRLIY